MKSVSKKISTVMLAIVMFSMTASFALADYTQEVILSAGTTQAFSDETVPEEDVNAILAAGLSATSAINQQPWFLVAVTDKDVMSEISAAGGNFAPPAGFGGGEGRPEGAPAGFPGSEGKPEGVSSGFGGAPVMPAASGAKASLGDSPLAIIIYKNENTASPDASFDCGLCAQNMYIAASALGYGVKIVSSPATSLNGSEHDALCAKLGVDPSLKAVAVLLIGKIDTSVEAATGASTRAAFEEKTVIIK